MKKYAIATLALIMAAALLTGCGCMNSKAEPTMPSTKATTAPATEATRPSSTPTTIPTTEATIMPSMGATGETAGENDMVGSESTEATTAPQGRAGAPMDRGNAGLQNSGL